MTSLNRRSFLQVAGTGVLLSAAAPTAWAAGGDKPLRVYSLVVDGCSPDEITPRLTPRLHELREAGTSFPQARSLPVMETIPNHVMMMSGVRPDRSGVPANSVYDAAQGEIRTLDRASDLRFDTLLDRLHADGKVTGSVLSKEYLHGIFGTRASVRWEPRPIVPISGHAPDIFTASALVSMVDSSDPDLVFANFGDVDRLGHADLTGTTLRAARAAALASADAQVGRFVDHLVRTDRWSSSVLLICADHSMDWSWAHRVISLSRAVENDPLLTGRVQIAQNGGAELLYFTGPEAEREAAVSRLRELALATEGVLSAHDPAELRLGPEAGDLVVYCEPGWRFADPEVISNPIPGNHGHPATEPIPFFITGGHPAIRTGTSAAEARTIDVAPTLGALFGLPAPTGGYDGTARTEAFDLTRL
ncbi:Predicted pyrophosphatase or phosphodiesterase, AlkP superfamily [Saccharopolyspora antimicrobica]|uniref:AlkP superfamily pyrophosphatase or phosphodiesterase n=1 Tax=Saccharopolyspora antimicrobica TaxID=455193 RepID=A0A1I5JPL4_9PSEU|nr:alkaline phosphatase family protein [Saccharopolyspora antimicrobica]RKT84705.1 putative AlkP superfamily pyrophosphatase or phosphodiesterase [Saccharopolyspora antimicrobica]SFO74276.1 Predicted pyrophosphatase or phosphodiesterase, AlkP superfamily [Saccharopolyspora antimicrobica]